MTAAPGPQQPDEVHTCWHPFGCQAPGDGCHGPCPVTPEEGRRIESDLTRDLCSCGHGLLLHDGGENCTMPDCPCTWFYEGRPDWSAQPVRDTEEGRR